MALSTFVTVEGGLLPSQMLERIVAADRRLDGTAPDTYHVETTTELNQAISRAWASLGARWAAYRTALAALPEQDRATTVTRERWLLPLFQELGFGRLQGVVAGGLGGRAISHVWSHVPIHLVGARLKLDTRVPGERGAAAASPHGLVQDLLNHEEMHLWAFLSNGLELRLLRDHRSLTRQAYIAFDLESIFDGEQFSAFRMLYLLCHQSRVEADKPTDCWLEKWFSHARDEGIAAQEKMREGFERALCALGAGFLKHPANSRLLADLAANVLSTQDYYRQLLRLVYRMIFLFVAEDRGVLLVPGDEAKTARDRYSRLYASGRLRCLAMRRRGGPHGDGWQAMLVVMHGLERGCPDLALPGLGSFLWGSEANPTRPGERQSRALPDLETCSLANEALFEALHALCIVQDGPVRRRVDWASVQADELGSVYEALMERVPRLNAPGGFFELAVAPGNERKTTGSYYTPSQLVDCLLDSSLEPVLDEACKKAEPEKAILDLAVVDPACGSGHFLVAAARRISKRLARVRSGGIEPSPPEVQHALRDVVGRCVYGVDVNPMAVELCKVSLWMEAVEPGRPLSFLDAHIQYGNALLGATPELMANGVPDVAWAPSEDDDKRTATALKKRNTNAASGQRGLDALWVAPSAAESAEIARIANELELAPDKDTTSLVKKEATWTNLVGSDAFRHQHFVADMWCSAFFWPKKQGPLADAAPTNDLWRQVRDGVGQPPTITLQTVQDLAARHAFLHWHLVFPTVFARGGFDVVIGNPPWVRQELLKSMKRFLVAYRSFSSTADSSVYFLEKGVDVCRPAGRIALLTPNKWFRANYAEGLREHLRSRSQVDLLIDFGHSRNLFPDADTFPAAIVLRASARRVPDTELARFVRAHDSDRADRTLQDLVRGHSVSVAHGNFTRASWRLEDSAGTELLERLLRTGRPLEALLAKPILSGLKTGFNAAFYIDTPTRDALLRSEPASAIFIKKLLRGRDVKRWTPQWAGQWHIVIPSSQNRTAPWSSAENEVEAEGIFAAEHPALHGHLKGFEDRLRGRQDKGVYWWELRACDYYDDFEMAKVVVQDIIFYAQFAFDRDAHFVNNSVFVLPTDDLYTLSVLNSRVAWWVINRTFQHMKDDGIRVNVDYLKRLPIPNASPQLRNDVISVAQDLVSSAGRRAGAEAIVPLELKLNDLIERAFELTEGERHVLVSALPPRDPIAVLGESQHVAAQTGVDGFDAIEDGAAERSGFDNLEALTLASLPADVHLGDVVWTVMPWPHDRPPREGEQVAVRQSVECKLVVALGKARVGAQRDATSGASLMKLVITGAGANAELSFTEAEWATFRPLGLAERA